jgi:hypothetical protein
MMNQRGIYLASLALPLVIFFVFFLAVPSGPGLGVVLTCSIAIFHDLAYVIEDGRPADAYLIRSAAEAAVLLVCALLPLLFKRMPLVLRIGGFACWLGYLAMNFFQVVGGV